MSIAGASVLCYGWTSSQFRQQQRYIHIRELANGIKTKQKNASSKLAVRHTHTASTIAGTTTTTAPTVTVSQLACVFVWVKTFIFNFHLLFLLAVGQLGSWSNWFAKHSLGHPVLLWSSVLGYGDWLPWRPMLATPLEVCNRQAIVFVNECESESWAIRLVFFYSERKHLCAWREWFYNTRIYICMCVCLFIMHFAHFECELCWQQLNGYWRLFMRWYAECSLCAGACQISLHNTNNNTRWCSSSKVALSYSAT